MPHIDFVIAKCLPIFKLPSTTPRIYNKLICLAPKTKRYYRIVERIGQTKTCLPPSKPFRRNSRILFHVLSGNGFYYFLRREESHPYRLSILCHDYHLHAMRNATVREMTLNQSHEPKGGTQTSQASITHRAYIYENRCDTIVLSVWHLSATETPPRRERASHLPPPAVGCWLNNGPRREGTTCQLSRHECSDISSRSRAHLRSDSILKHDSHSPPSANLPSNVRTTNAVGR